MIKNSDKDFLQKRRSDIDFLEYSLAMEQSKFFSGINHLDFLSSDFHDNKDDYKPEVIKEKIKIYTDNYHRIARDKKYRRGITKKEYPEGSSQIFDFIYALDNDVLSSMSSKDLQQFLILLDQYYLEYRESLGLDASTTFGFEVEYENPQYIEIQARLNEANLSVDWEQTREDTLNFGAEIASPVLTDKKICWDEFQEVCEILSPLAIITYDCGGHIHVGENILGSDKNLLRFIKLWATYENVIHRFLYGEYLSNRYSLPKYARPLSQEIWKNLDCIKTKEDFTQLVNISDINDPNQKAAAILCKRKTNLKTGEQANTIEFRTPNCSFNPIIWQNNLNLLVRLLEYASSDSFDEEVLNRRHHINSKRYSNLSFYKEIFMDQALELADLIFDRNIDKVYFLRQYLKSFERSNDYRKAKTFTR